MAFLGKTFEAEPTGGDRGLLPEGWYTARITKAELLDTRSGAGQYILVHFYVLGPSHQGRVVYGRITVRHQNAQAEEIGRRQLGELIRACGLKRISDTDELLGHTLQVKVLVRPASGGYQASNAVRGFKAAVAPTAPLPTSQTAPGAPAWSVDSTAPPARAGDSEGDKADDKPLPPWLKK